MMTSWPGKLGGIAVAHQVDVVVMGGGPAGAAAGNVLARAGFDVLIVERDRHPRHHIGESLLPGSVPVLGRLGVSPAELAARFQPKFGARFYDPAGDRMATFGFEPTPGSASPAFQVVREEFDALLAARAREAGCQFWENAPVTSFDEDADRPRVTLADGREVEAQFLIDATGRDAAIAAKRRGRRPMAEYGRVGLYNYFADLPPHDGDDARFITMYVFDGGWVWLIPLADGRTSVGIVYRQMPEDDGRGAGGAGESRPERLFWRAAATMPRLATRLRAARATDAFRAIPDYSFTVDRKCGPRWAAVGDAGGFLDPIFSSGVHLALSSAEWAGAAVIELLRGGSDAGLHAYAAHTDAGFRVFQAFVHRFYHRDLVRNLFFMPDKPPEIHAAITRILAGHVWDRDNPVIRMIGHGS